MALPHPINGEQEYLAAILDELKAIRSLLLPERVQPVETNVVQLKEPAKTGKRK